jgi:hypothetical protein
MPRTAGAMMTASATRAFFPFMAVSCLLADATPTESRAPPAPGKGRGSSAPLHAGQSFPLFSFPAKSAVYAGADDPAMAATMA